MEIASCLFKGTLQYQTHPITGNLAGWKKPYPSFLQTAVLEKEKTGSSEFPQLEMESSVVKVWDFSRWV